MVQKKTAPATRLAQMKCAFCIANGLWSLTKLALYCRHKELHLLKMET